MTARWTGIFIGCALRRASATRTRRQTHCGDQSGAFRTLYVYGTNPESGYCLRVPSTLLIPFYVYRFFNAENSAEVRCLKIYLFLSFFPPLSFSRVPIVYNPQHVSVEPSGCIGRILQHAPCAYWRRNHLDLREHRDCLRDEEHGLRQGDPVDARLSDRSGDHRLNLWLGAQ